MNSTSITVCVLSSLALFQNCCFAQNETQESKQHFIVVGVSEEAPYGHSMTINSAKAIADALKVFNHEELAEPSIRRLFKDPNKLGSRAPTGATIRDSILETLNKCNSEDECWFFFCGHGCDIGSQSFLVPGDVEPSLITRSRLEEDPTLEEKLVSVNWIVEQMRQAEIREGIVVIDACRIQLADHQDEARLANPIDNISVLRSCTSGQRSLLWPKRHSALYSYWLVHGLRGGADVFTDGRITPYELSQFLNDRVTQSLPKVLQEIFDDPELSSNEAGAMEQDQVPEYWGNKYACSAELSLSDITYSQAMTGFQQHVYDLLYSESHNWDENQRYTVAINEFLECVADGKVALHGPNGCLGQIATEGLTSDLKSRGAQLFDVISPRVVRDYLLSAGSEIQHPPTKWEETKADYFLSTMFIRSEDDRQIQLESKLYRTGNKEPIGRLVSFISVNPEIEAVMGHTDRVVPPHSQAPATLRPVRISEREVDSDHNVPVETENAEESERQGNGQGHPLAIETPPVPEIDVFIERKRQDSGENEYVRARSPIGAGDNERVIIVQKEDQIRIRVHNPSDHVLAIVPMVDGITTLGKRGGLTPELAVKESLYFTIQPGQNGIIPGWLTRLNARDGDRGEEERDGEVEVLGEFECSDFIVTAPPASVARQLGFGADLGEIRIVVFPTGAKRSGNSTTRSNEEQVGIGEGFKRERVIEQDVVNVAKLHQGARVVVIRYQKAAELFGENIQP